MKITVHSVIENLNDAGLAYDEPEISIITSEAVISRILDTVLISYTEKADGGEVKTRITVKDGTVHLLREGAIEWNVLFDEGATAKTVYKIPPYAFDCAVETKRVRIKDGEPYEIRLVYAMNIGGGQKNATMRITLG